ncbi:response regulator [Elusimicrobiota bacterium]
MSELKVLLIDDEQDLVSALVERLGYRGVKSKYALNGQQAIDMMQKESFDAVVLDLKLPGMSGAQVHDIIKKQYPGLPILLITGHGAPPDQLGFKPGEDYDFLEKPVSIETLLERIREAVKKR